MPGTEQQLRLVDAGDDREAIATYRIFSSKIGIQILEKLGISWPGYWCILRTALNDADDGMKGELDVIAGRLSPVPTPEIPKALQNHASQISESPLTLAMATQTPIVPWQAELSVTFDFSYLIGIEVKCGYVDVSPLTNGKAPEAKGLKSGPGKLRDIQKQLRRAIDFGFDSVCFLEVIAGPPISTTSVADSIHSFSVSSSTADFHPNLGVGEALKDFPVSHCKLVVSPTLLTTENVAGSFRFGFRKPPVENPELHEAAAMERRANLILKLRSIVQRAFASQQLFGAPVVIDQFPSGEIVTNQNAPVVPHAGPAGVIGDIQAICSNGIQIGPGETFVFFDIKGIPISKKS